MKGFENFRFVAKWSHGFVLHLVFTNGGLDEVITGYQGYLGVNKNQLIDFLTDMETILKVQGYYDKMCNDTLTKNDVLKIAEIVLTSWFKREKLEQRTIDEVMNNLKNTEVSWKVYSEDIE